MNNRKMKRLVAKKAQILTTNKHIPTWCKALKNSLYRLYNINAVIEYDVDLGYIVSIENNKLEKLSITSAVAVDHEMICDFMG